MAGRVKHMERSRRSYRQSQQYGIFNQFHAHAYAVASLKTQRKTIGQRFASLLAPLKNALKSSATKNK